MAGFETVEIRIEGPIAEIYLNRPDALNAVNPTMHHELIEAFRSLHAHDELRAVIFGAHGKVFSAGGDFDQILADHADRDRRTKIALEAKPLMMAAADCPVPVIAAMHGEAIGLGATLILGSDAVVAARNVRISDPHVVIGLAAGDGGCVVWPLSAGLLTAKRYLLTGDRITAEVAYNMGLVTDLVDTPEEVLPAARAIAARIAKLPPIAVRHTKKALNQILRQRVESVFELGMALELDTFATDDLVEAVTAFRDKRPPDYQGR